MENHSTRTTRPIPRHQLLLDELLMGFVTFLFPIAVILLLTGIITACVMIITRFLWPNYRHERTRPLLERQPSESYELNDIYTSPGHNTI